MDDSFKERISKCTLQELLEIESSLDKDAYPERYSLLKEEIHLRRSAGQYVPQAFTCPHCAKPTISHCAKLNAGIIKCSACGEQLYLDPNRTDAASSIGFAGVMAGAFYQSCWPALIGLILMIILRDTWVVFVPKNTHTYRKNTNNLITLIIAGLISVAFTLWAIFAEPSHVPAPRSAFIAVQSAVTLAVFGFSVYFFKKRKS